MIYIIEFFLFSFLGWIMDSIYGSIKHKRTVVSGYYKHVPLCPMYGFGGILLLNSFALFHHLPAWVVILTTTVLIIAFEYIGGKLSEFVLEERLWDYSTERYHFQGYISLWHSFLWLVVVTLLYFLMADISGAIIEWLRQKTIIESHLEVMIFLAVIGFLIWATVKNKKSRLLKRLEKQVVEALK